MSCVKSKGPTQRRLRATSTVAVPEWLGDWEPAIGRDAATAVLKVANLGGNLQVTPVVQTAEVRTDQPDAPSTIGALANQDANGEYYFDAADCDLATKTAGKTFVRYGVLANVSSAGQGQADVTFEVVTKQCGTLHPPVNVHLVASTDDDHFIPVSGWFPTLGVVKVAATIVVSSHSGDLTIKLTSRTATTSTATPDAWDGTGLGSAITADTEENTGELTPTTTDKALIQFGLLYSSATFGQADVQIALGVRSSS